MPPLKKYAGLWVAFFRASLIADLEYRTNFITRIVTDVMWYLAQIVTFETLFRHTRLVGHWTLPQTRVFLGLLFVTDAFYMIFFQENLERFSDRVRKGELDLLLAKPVNSQFMVSLQRASTATIGNLLMALTWMGWALSGLPEFSWPRVAWLLLLVPSGMLILYSLRFVFTACAVLFTRAESIQFLFYQLYKMGMRPDAIFGPHLRFVLMTLVPVALIASVPARALLDPADPALFLWSFAVALIALFLTTRFWRFCLRHYSSASS